MLEQWAASRESGSMTFAWEWDGRRLASRPGLLRVLSLFNRSRAPHSARSARRTRALTSRVERGTARELHYTYAGPSAVTFDWAGTAQVLHYGRTASYGATIRAHAPPVKPFSSAGPFWEATINGLKPGRSYRYSVGPIRSVFRTPPVGPFRFDFEADVGASDAVLPTQNQIAADKPAFTIVAGDLTYGNDDGQAAVDRHFDDVMVWSRRAAYVPAWGNHEWDSSSDDLRNYKGRFTMPHAQAAVGAPARGCCGDDWGWFDAGGVRFISYPEPYTDATWPDWGKRAAAVMAAAETNPRIHFIVTFGHRPAYSTGYHPGDTSLASVLNGLGDRFSKYVLNLNGHSHDYERFNPIHHVVHITAGGGGADLEPWSSGKDRRDAFRALHLEHLRVDVTQSQIRIQTVCGPSSSAQDLSCRPGSVIDSYAIAAPRT
jgi:calcineurin-like phosphoesterase family protein